MAAVGSPTGIRLRPATPEDRFRIRRWLAAPEVQAWWGNAASAEAEITLAMGSEAALARIIESGDEPIGYAHAVEIGLWGQERPDQLAPGTWDIDLFIAEESRRGRGLGSIALALLTEEVFATTLAVACCAVVSVRNEAGVRAYEGAGFRWQRIWNDPLFGPSWLLLKERPSQPRQRRRADRPPPAAARR
jgi:RimJ/RimL family protein N-acetyltransferase